MKRIVSVLVFVLLLFIMSLPCQAQWAVRIGGIGSAPDTDDVANSIKQTADGGYILVGTIGGTIWGADTIDEDFWVIKLNADGTVAWQKAYGMKNQYGWEVYDSAYSVQQTADGGYIVAGETDRFRFWVLKLNADSSIVWQKIYGNQFFGARDIEQTKDGGYIVAGLGSGIGSATDFGLLKLYPNGSVEWEKSYGVLGFWDNLRRVQQTADGGYIVSGGESRSDKSHFWVLKLNPDGTIVWQKNYGGTDGEDPAVIQQTADGGYIVAGSTVSFGAYGTDILVLKLDSLGRITWQKRYAGRGLEYVGAIQQTTEGGYVLAGSTDGSFGSGGSRVWVLKLNQDGTLAWDKTYGGRFSGATSIEQTKDGGYIVAGWIKDWTFAWKDILILKLDANGDIPGCSVTGESNIAYSYDVSAAVADTYAIANSKNSLVLDATATIRTPNFQHSYMCMVANHLPVVNAGYNITITSQEEDSTIITGTATDEDPSDVLNYRWREGETTLLDWTPAAGNGECPLNLASTPISLGTHFLTLEVSDGHDIASDEMVLIIGNSAPYVVASGGGVHEIYSDVALNGQVSDYDGDLLLYEWLEGTTVLFSGQIQASSGGNPIDLPTHILLNIGLGEHNLILQVSDGVNEPVRSEITLNILDTTVPKLSPLANKTILWPPNHKMVDIVIEANAYDNSGLPVILSVVVTSNEPEEGLGDGDMSPDWSKPEIDQALGIINLQLRDERGGHGNGREYTLKITATDEVGNSTTSDMKIIVPHDRM